jgi:hypothetical protein
MLIDDNLSAWGPKKTSHAIHATAKMDRRVVSFQAGGKLIKSFPKEKGLKRMRSENTVQPLN